MYCFEEKTLENAIAAYEEYKKNERILNGEGLVPLPHNLNFHNYYREVVPGVIEEVSAYDTLGNKIATWNTYKSNAKKNSTISTEGSISINKARQMKLTCVWDKSELSRIKSNYGALAYIKSTNETYIGTPEGGWTPIRVLDDATKDNKNITNCRNCGAPIKSCICEYCGTVIKI